MAQYQVDKITASKYGDGDRWRFSINGDWFDAYLALTEADMPQVPALLDLEWKESKTGKQYIVSVDGKGRTGGAGSATVRQAAPAASAAPSAPASARLPESGPRPYDATRDQWILISTIVGHTLDRLDGRIGDDELRELAEGAAKAARAAARVMAGAVTDAARVAVTSAPPPPPTPHSRPAQPTKPMEHPVDQTDFGPGFDDGVPF
jgi:hypothetical protein